MDPVKFNCPCVNATSRWTEMAPEHPHRYKVECDHCKRHIKWGAERELHYRVKARDKITVIPYEDQIEPPRSSLDKFFTE